MGIGGSPKIFCGTATEELCLGQQLRVDFQADDRAHVSSELVSFSVGQF
jgi:hypothetical protein